MGRKRKKSNRGLPKGVYPEGGKYRSLVWNPSAYRLENAGLYDTPEEAEYRRTVYLNGHHWEGIEEGPYIGFIYHIVNKKTGKRYVGSKQMYFWDGPTGGYKCYDMESEWWDPKAWRCSDWKTYTGSSGPLNREIRAGNIWDYRFKVIQMCGTKLDLHIAELDEQLKHNVLDAVDENGEYLWYNESIMGVEFRPPFKKDEVATLKEVSLEAMRNYYLKPDMDAHGRVIPFGHLPCVRVRDEVIGVFEDVRYKDKTSGVQEMSTGI